MNITVPLFSDFSPTDPEWVNFWAQRYYSYEIYTLIFLVFLTAAFISITVVARRTPDIKLRKRLWLVRKIGTWVALIAWGIFAAIGLNIITLP